MWQQWNSLGENMLTNVGTLSKLMMLDVAAITTTKKHVRQQRLAALRTVGEREALRSCTQGALGSL